MLKRLIQQNTLSSLVHYSAEVFPVLFTNSSYWLEYASSIHMRCSNHYLLLVSGAGDSQIQSLLHSLLFLDRSDAEAGVQQRVHRLHERGPPPPFFANRVPFVPARYGGVSEAQNSTHAHGKAVQPKHGDEG